MIVFQLGHRSLQINWIKVGRYLVELQTMNPATPDLTSVTTGLRNLDKQ